MTFSDAENIIRKINFIQISKNFAKNSEPIFKKPTKKDCNKDAKIFLTLIRFKLVYYISF